MAESDGSIEAGLDSGTSIGASKHNQPFTTGHDALILVIPGILRPCPIEETRISCQHLTDRITI